jgi:hypothetical protein
MNMDAEFRLDSDGTVFQFCVTEKGFDDYGYFWTDASLEVSNQCLNYCASSHFMEFSELIALKDGLYDLLNNNISTSKTLEFIEPDIKVILNPQRDLRNDERYIFIKDGYEIEDISAEFHLFPFLNGVLTEQHYVMPLYRDEIESFVEYLTKAIDTLK